MVTLSPHAPKSLWLHGTCTLSVSNRSIQINSDATNRAGVMNGAGVVIDASNLDVVGSTAGIVPGGNLTGDLWEGAPPKEDPLAELPAPTWNPADDLGTVVCSGGQTLNLQPGYYSGGISMTGGQLTLSPGIYILDGKSNKGGLDINGGTFTANGVMIYITGRASVDIGGNATIELTPGQRGVDTWDGVGIYEGVSIFQDTTPRGRRSSAPLQWTCTGRSTSLTPTWDAAARPAPSATRS